MKAEQTHSAARSITSCREHDKCSVVAVYVEEKCEALRWTAFFFSSRRRHTRLQGDWSSDVCSRSSAIGQLIAGVAHELNNPLTAILGYAQLLETETLEARAKEYAGKIFKQAQRTHRVVQNLLSFARQRKPEKHQFDVVKVLEESLLLRDYDMKVGSIKLEREIGPAIPAVTGDPHQLEQVFLNIVNNAVDAMIEDGKPDTERRLKVVITAQDNLVTIVVQDSGPGLKEPHRIFEPFYTTKSIGKG